MNTPLFPNGITGLSDTKWSGSRGNAHKLVGVDFRSTPGIIKAHQKLKKISSEIVGEVETDIVTELCKDAIEVSDGSKLWFSSESGKIWRQVGDVFTLIHTVDVSVDFNEPNSIVDGVVDDEDIDYDVTLSIAENDAVYGDISNTVASTFDATAASEISVIELSSGYYAIAYRGESSDGYVKTFQLTSSDIYSEIEPLEHDTTFGGDNSICKIDATHFILAYKGGASSLGYIKTFTANYGSLTQTNVLNHDVAGGSYNSIIQIDATHYALAYSDGATDHGVIKIFTIDGSFAITQTSTLTHDGTGTTYGHKLALIDSTHFILAYSGGIKTFSIDGAYNITEIDSIPASGGSIQNAIIKLDSTHYAWSGMVGVRGYVKIFEIDGSYNITEKTDLDIMSYNYYPSLVKTDPNHIVLSSANQTTGFTKVFEIDSNYVIKEVGSADFTGGTDTSIIRAGRRILTAHQAGSIGSINVATINETFSNGIVLKPSGTDKIKLIASKSKSQTGMATQYLKESIKIPENYDNMEVVVIAGRGVTGTPAVGATVAGNAMTQINSRDTSDGFGCNISYFSRVNPTAGDNEIIVDFGSAASYVYMIVLVYANVHQTTPYLATNDYGWKDYLTLPGTEDGDLRIGAFLSKINNHYHGKYEDFLISNDIAESTDRYTISVSSRPYYIGTDKIMSATEFSYTQAGQEATEDQDFKAQEQIKKIYYCNENVLFAVPVDRITDWADYVETIGVFYNGDDTYHPMAKQNLELFIGDKIVISKIDTAGNFIQQTSFNVAEPERIQQLSNFDTDILVGTKYVNKARVLRWDTFSDSWLADDEVFESGINAFIKDDNYTYVSAGDFGRLYFYNGEKLELYKRIPGTWDSTHKAKINANATDYYMGNPVFGLSNVTGNPTEQGIYGFGNYDVKYKKALSLDFPLPTNEFEGVEIGVILVSGPDMTISYKTATDVGVARIDHSNKYANAYIETMMLTPLKERNSQGITEKICADYVSLPDDTSVTIATKTKYDTDYSPMTIINDTAAMSILTKNNVPKTVNLQIKFGLVSDGNDSPEIENLGIV